MQLALAANQINHARTWQLMESLLVPTPSAPSLPPTPPLSPLPLAPVLPHSMSAPAAIPSIASLQTSSLLPPSRHSFDHHQYSSASRLSPTHSPRRNPSSGSNSPSPHRTSQSITPASPIITASGSASAQSPVASLHTPSPTSSRGGPPASIFARRSSNSQFFVPPATKPRTLSSYRRPSMSMSTTSPALTDSVGSLATISNTSSGSLRHVGEGALDDSDSSSGGEKGVDVTSDEGNNTAAGGEKGRDASAASSRSRDKSHSRSSSINTTVTSPTTLTFPTRVLTAHGHVHGHGGVAPSPSPLSRVAGQGTFTDSDELSDEKSAQKGGTRGNREHDGDDDDSEDSPSPASTTDTDSDDSPRDASAVRLISAERSSSDVRRRSTSRSTTRTRSRKNSVTTRPKGKRTSTLALTVPPRPESKALARQGSTNSMRTVTAEDTSLQVEHVHDGSDTMIMSRKEGLAKPSKDASPASGKRGVSGGGGNGGQQQGGSLFASTSVRPEREERSESVHDQRFKADIEKKHQCLKDWGWSALKATFEDYAEEGDVQICALMALVAGEELSVKPSRVMRFVDSYIGERCRPITTPPPHTDSFHQSD